MHSNKHHGSTHTPAPRGEHRAAIRRIHPDRNTAHYVTEEEAQAREARAMLLGHTAHIAHLPFPFLSMLRDGHPDDPVTVDIGDTSVTLIPADDGDRIDPEAELAAWTGLCDTITDLKAGFGTRRIPRVSNWVRADLPREIAVATWYHRGEPVHAFGPSCTARHRRTARTVHRQSKLAGLAIVGLCGVLYRQALGGGTAAATATTAAAGVLAIGVGAATAPAIMELDSARPEMPAPTATTTGHIHTGDQTPAPSKEPKPAKRNTTMTQQVQVEPIPTITSTPAPADEPLVTVSPTPEPAPTDTAVPEPVATVDPPAKTPKPVELADPPPPDRSVEDIDGPARHDGPHHHMP